MTDVQSTVTGTVRRPSAAIRIAALSFMLDAGFGIANRDLFNHIKAARALAELPVPLPVSQACRLYRVKRAGLRWMYQARGVT